ncbi:MULTISPECIES: aminotransferase class III-fold pyridoxal phosphate-dependent enzyme [Curtobacterium]|uniref:aminotransferase class III-fold pyridoxal phosphate-dependent enzyme n=1 Tax=Curtobacterium flaccumfaciens TaxID=2035 RepID=UPI003EE7ABF6
MTTPLFDYFEHQELPTPTIPTDEATRLLASTFGIEATLRSLGSQQDQNFLVGAGTDDTPIGVLKISNPVFSEAEIDLQGAAAARVAAAEPGIRVPVETHAGWWETSAGRVHARIISFVHGATLTGSSYLAPAVVARLGELAARVQGALEGLDHPAAARTLQWDLRHAARVARDIAPTEPDAALRSETTALAASAQAVLDRVGDRLPRQLGHFDITDDNVLHPDGDALPDAVIDFGDVSESWSIGELATTISSVLHHDGASPLSTLPAIRAFHARRPITADEADALWPLVVLRGVVLVLSGRAQTRIDEDNAYASAALDRELAIMRVAASVPIPVMTGIVRDALGLPAPTGPSWTTRVIDVAPVVLDATVTSPVNDDGRWLDADALDAAARGLLDGGAGAVVLPAWRPVLTGAPHRTPEAPATIPTGATVWLAEPTTLGPDLLRAGGTSLQFDVDGTTLPARTPIRVSVVTDGTDVPAQVTAATAVGWRTIVGDPAPAFGLPEAVIAPDRTLQRREHVLAEVQEHYYVDPPRMERGWREYLVDADGRVYLDMVNNVTAVGHAHPRVAEAASRQFRLLNTNSRFNYAQIVEYGERIAATLPEELDTVFFVNSGSEATDLAIRIATGVTGRPDVVAMREAYHGWTFASDAVSTSIADNPNALATRPAWVHTVDAANSYRGAHRGEDASRYAPEAVDRIRRLAADGYAPAAFICEPYFGNAGGVALPDGYLAAVYGAVRELGGLTIADEVQVGFGRLGNWFWGHQQQDVVPDIVAVAKSVGNGHPIGIVVTTRVIADQYRNQGYFFSSTGGSPVSSAVGTAVLDVIQQEGLQENARVVGDHLATRLRELGDRHPIVGAVHGSGLYLGLEFVRDRTTLEPATSETAAICDRLLELGVIMQPTGDHLNVLKIKPPLVVTTGSVDYFVDALDRTLTTGW